MSHGAPEGHDGRDGPAAEQLREPEDGAVASEGHRDVQRRRHARGQGRAAVVRGDMRGQRAHGGEGGVGGARGAATGVIEVSFCAAAAAAGCGAAEVLGCLRPQRGGVAPCGHLQTARICTPGDTAIARRGGAEHEGGMRRRM